MPSGSGPAIDPGRTAFDFDGVLADTMELFVDLVRQQHPRIRLRYEDITCYELETCLSHVPAEVIRDVITQILGGRAPRPIRPLPGARQVVRRLVRNGGRLLCVTARSDPGPVRDWIEHQLAVDADTFDVVATGTHEEKAGVLKLHGICWFVEDRLETCRLLDVAGIVPVLFRQPWNRSRHHFQEVDSWGQLGRLLALP